VYGPWIPTECALHALIAAASFAEGFFGFFADVAVAAVPATLPATAIAPTTARNLRTSHLLYLE
jgi:hypothetical protein